VVKNYNVKILDINKCPDCLQCVINLWKLHSKILGFFPKGAFEEYAYKKQILIVHDQEGYICGYVLYRVSKQKISITHLCVDELCRQAGLARLLLDQLRIETEGLKGIGLYCRRDYLVNEFWPKLGFIPINEKKGRGKNNATLTYWWNDYRSKNLFTEIIKNELNEKISIVIDANVFYDLDDKNKASESIESKSLSADWFKGETSICVTDEIYMEINRSDSEEERLYQRNRVSDFNFLETDKNNVDNIVSELSLFIREPRKEQDRSDFYQLAHAISADADFFITRDEFLLRQAEYIYDKYGLDIKRPAEVILEVDNLYDEISYRPARLAGTLGVLRLVVNNEIEKISKIFCLNKEGEKRNILHKRLAKILSQTEKYRVYVAEDKEGIPLAVIAISINSEVETMVPFARVKEGVLGSTLSRYLLFKIIIDSLKSKYHTIVFSDEYVQPVFVGALKDEGFIQLENSWNRLVVNAVIDLNELEESIPEHASFGRIIKIIDDVKKSKEKYSLIELENFIWPGKVLEDDIPCFIVPIKPGWARGLFDEDLANQDLFGADLSLAVQNEGVYYYSIKGGKTTAPARILWYVSHDNKIPGSAAIRACSILKEVSIDAPKVLFKKYRRLGVYKWEDVLKAAGNDCGNKLAALHFGKTELFSAPILFKDMQKILEGLPLNKSIITATQIPVDVFMRIYKLGIKNNEKFISES